ncbi:carbohydrate porin [Sulfurimonas sp. MAG313]|nr:hypothetical protein [Sulfurimonas sp. MAG313]MDF1880396.1 carbohydrate porin [Sulfurimonas sp. MAG313]
MKKTLISLAVASIVTSSLFADAQTDALKSELKALTERLNSIETQTVETEEKTDSLLQEVADSKVADSFGNYNGQSYAGMAPGASKVYTNKNKLSIGGYGKVDYINYRDQTTKTSAGTTKTADQSNSYRAIIYVGYRFTDNIIFNSEIEFEHGGDTVEVEQLSLDFLVNDMLNFRVGTYVVPIGLVSVNHEPTLFNPVNRPLTERNIIPSTWYENGGMVYGSFIDSTLSYRTGIVSGFNASKGATLRKMRGEGKKSAADDAGYYLRLDYAPSENFNIAGSYYYGNAGQNSSKSIANGAVVDVNLEDVSINLYEVHATAKYAGFEANALYAVHKISDADKVAIFNGKDATKEGFGYYANLNYTYGDWVPFAQYEVSNAFDSGYQADGITATNYANQKDITFGINWKTHPQIVLKADYIVGKLDDRTNTGTAINNDRFELGMGYVF